MKIVDQIDTGTGLGIDRLVLESDHGQLRIEIVYAAEGFELRVLSPGQKMLIKPIAANACEIRGTRY